MKTKVRKISVLLIVTLIFMLTITGCKSSDYKKANSLMEQGKYVEAKTMFEELGDYEESVEKIKECDYRLALQKFEENKYDEGLKLLTSLKDYRDSSEKIAYGYVEHVRFFIGNNDYEKAIEVLQNIPQEVVSGKERAKLNIEIVRGYIEEHGVHGNEGKRLYTSNDGEIIYLENSNDGSIILGFEMENSVGSNQLKVFLNGDSTPYFEAEQHISFTLLGHTNKSDTKGNGTATLNGFSSKLTLDSFSNSGAVSTSGNTVVNAIDKDDFKSTFKSILVRTVSSGAKILSNEKLGITIGDMCAK